MPTYSYSRIGTYGDCPRLYKFSYIEKPEVEIKETVETFLGSRVHEALEKLYRDKRHEKALSLEELLAYFDRLWSEKWNDRILIVRKDYSAENYRRMGKRFLGDYYRRYAPFEQGRVIGLETQETVALDEKAAVRFHVRIDRLVDMGDGLYEVHDYKTSSTLPDQETLDRDLQLGAYSLWVRRRFPDFMRVRLVWHFLAFDKEMESWRTDKDLEKVRQELLEKIGALEAATEFPPRASALCDWCLYRSLCPLWSHESRIAGLPENEYLDEPGVKLVDEYVRLKSVLEDNRREIEKKIEKVEQALVALCRDDLEEEKIVVVSGSTNRVTIREQKQVKWPAKNTEERSRLIGVLKDLGRWEEVSDLDLYALSRIIKNDRALPPEVRAFLEAFGKVEQAYKLTVSKKKEKETR
jgi:putative RecB family exonuclease